MTSNTTLLERLAPSDTGGSRAERGRAWFDSHGLPDPRAEAWRYTPLTEIQRALEQATPAPAEHSIADRGVIDELAGDHRGPRLVFVNGVFAAALSDTGSAEDGLWLGDAEALRPRRTPGAPAPQDEPVDGFHALNWAAGVDVAAVLAEPEARIDTPVHIVHVAAPGDDMSISHPRTVIRLGSGASLHVIETFVGTGGRSLTNASTRIVASQDSSLTYHRVIHEPAGAIHVGRTGIEQAARSTVSATAIVTGGDIVRNAVDVGLAGDGATVELEGLYVTDGRERHDNVITVDHAASHCTSRQRYKGIIDDHGRGSFSGHVIVRHGTVGTDAVQSNPNLVLTPTAQADTRPWLEIFADDVRCAHGATVGRLDDDAYFYLRSRGIPSDQARAMLIAAFAAEVIDAITLESLRERLADWLHTRTEVEGQ
ncbi:MAG: Fe-S cluster assembly protein SufD [Microthrixaceae bacterium]